MGDGARATATGMSGTVIEPAAEADLAEIALLERRSFSDPWSARSFAELIANPRVLFLCARTHAGGPAVGYVVAWFVADEGEIANLAVSPDERGQGVGAALLDAALSEASRRGALTVYLEVRDSNEIARALYGSRGFEEIGRRRRYYRRPVEDAVILRRTIASPVINADQ
jgi:ribosomal-protein-alanine N-acetyltransferase